MDEGLRNNDATIEYSVLHEEVLSGRELCTRLQRRIEEAGLSAGVHASSITVVDEAREPFKPVAPDPPLYPGDFAIYRPVAGAGGGVAAGCSGVIGRYRAYRKGAAAGLVLLHTKGGWCELRAGAYAQYAGIADRGGEAAAGCSSSAAAECQGGSGDLEFHCHASGIA